MILADDGEDWPEPVTPELVVDLPAPLVLYGPSGEVLWERKVGFARWSGKVEE